MLVVVIYDLDTTAVLFIFSHAFDIVFQKLKLSKDCIRAADAIYIFAPLRLYHNDRAQDNAAAKLVLIFFEGCR